MFEHALSGREASSYKICGLHRGSKRSRRSLSQPRQATFAELFILDRMEGYRSDERVVIRVSIGTYTTPIVHDGQGVMTKM